MTAAGGTRGRKALPINASASLQTERTNASTIIASAATGSDEPSRVNASAGTATCSNEERTAPTTK
jgi:hypothetical protein